MKGDDIANRLVDVGARVINVVDALPDRLTGRHVAGQLIRCATSAGSNYEEARGAESQRDFTHKLGISVKELAETRYWLRLIARARLVKPDRLTELLGDVDQLCRILGASQFTARRRSRSDHNRTE